MRCPKKGHDGLSHLDENKCVFKGHVARRTGGTVQILGHYIAGPGANFTKLTLLH